MQPLTVNTLYAFTEFVAKLTGAGPGAQYTLCSIKTGQYCTQVLITLLC